MKTYQATPVHKPDLGLELEKVEIAAEEQKKDRGDLYRAALDAVLFNPILRLTIGRKKYRGEGGYWWPELEPLTPRERQLVLWELWIIMEFAPDGKDEIEYREHRPVNVG